MEIWKDIKGYDGIYQISNEGRVKSLERDYTTELNGKRITMHKNEQIMKTHFSNYERVALYKNGKEKRFLVHRLVAEAFIENPNNYPIINHKDENPENNYVHINEDGSVDLDKSNLEWCTQKYNANYGTRIEKFREKQIGKPKYKSRKAIIGINKNTKEEITFGSVTEAATELNGSEGNISSALNGKIPSAYGYLWYFI